MDIWRLAELLKELTPQIVGLEGLVFLDRFAIGADGLRTEATKYGSLQEAQFWINIVPLSEWISEFVGEEWELDNPDIDSILSIFEKAWKSELAASRSGYTFRIERWKDEEHGDIGLKLVQSG